MFKTLLPISEGPHHEQQHSRLKYRGFGQPKAPRAVCVAGSHLWAELAITARNRRRWGDPRVPTTYLPAINNLLVEDPELVADAVTVGCQPQRGHGVQEASWKSRA